ncbi:MAG: type 4a pilus biogenesis protein PilO [Fimbriimonadales bacterium]|nr:type 4a pilus biogenesis protein PilO [Fimbriimonadales bacterium]
MKQKGPQPKVFIGLTALSIVAVAAAAYWQNGNVEKNESQVRTMKQEIGGTPNLVGQAELVKQEVLASQMELTHLEMGVATAAYVPTLLQELEATGKQCGLEIIGVRPMAKEQKKQPTEEKEKSREVRKAYDELDVEVKCKGEFGATMVFLQKLADFPKIVGVRHMSLDPKTKTDGLTLEAVDTTIVLRVYVFSQSPQASSASASTGTKQGAA